MSGYPAHRETDVVLRDGSTVHIRAARPDDLEALEDYFIGLSDESRRLRFSSLVVDVGVQAQNAVQIDYVDHLTLLAFSGGDNQRVVGGAQYIRETDRRAEIALSVTDLLQGQGLASILIAHLAQAANENGIEFFRAEVLPENHRMIGVFRQTGFPVSVRTKPGTVEIEFPTEVTDETAEHYEERLRIAGANAARTVLEARSVAVIGASRDPASIGGRLLKNLLGQQFAGVVYPVNPARAAIQGVRAYRSVKDIPEPVDVAFIAVPGEFVLDVVRECAEKRVRALVVISAGFGETGDDGRQLQAQLLEVCRAAGMRLIGPNCMGVINTDPEVSLNGTFAQSYPPEGRIAFMSQSGALGIAVINMATALSLGFSSFVSIGNKADVSANDLLCYWEEDPRTDVVLLYLESFGNPQRFASIVRRVGRRKPVVAVKSGRSAAGQRAATSHTGALLAASDRTVDALLRQVGVIRTDTLEEMFDVAALLANQPIPEGPKRRDRHQRRRPRNPVRRHVRGAGPRRARAVGRDDRRAAVVPAAGGGCLESGRHDRLRDRRRLRPHHQDRRCRCWSRRADRALHPAARGRRAGCRSRHGRRDRRARAPHPGAHLLHVGPRPAVRAVRRPRCGSRRTRSRSRPRSRWPTPPSTARGARSPQASSRRSRGSAPTRRRR